MIVRKTKRQFTYKSKGYCAKLKRDDVRRRYVSQ
jgi:hypothetical protein